MHNTLAAVAALMMAGPASAATVFFSGTVSSVATVSEYVDASGQLITSQPTYGAAGQRWFAFDHWGWLDANIRSAADGLLAPAQDSLSEGPKIASSYFDYGSGGWDNFTAQIIGQGDGSVSGSMVFGHGYGNNGTYTTYTLVGTYSAVPEAATWGMMLVGFGLMGAMVRQRRRSHEPG